MRRIQSESRVSMLGGRRVTLYDDASQPVVSLWAVDGRGLFEKAVALSQATHEPIDAILQAIAWHGKAAQA